MVIILLSAFKQMEQPLVVRVAVSLAGLGLIALELWWFLAHRKK
jgi:hypothetical protein